MNSTADDDSAYSSVPNFPTNSMNISSINMNDHEMINSNSTSDILSSTGISGEVIRNVPVTKNSTIGDTVDGERMEEEGRIEDGEEKEDVDHVERRGNVKDDDGNEKERIEEEGKEENGEEEEEEEKEETTKQEEEEDNQDEASGKEDETSQYDPSVLPSNPLTQPPNTTIQPKKKPRRRTRGFKPRFSYQNQKARRHHIQKVFIDTTLPVQPVLTGSRHSSRYSLILFTTADSHPVYHFLYSLI